MSIKLVIVGGVAAGAAAATRARRLDEHAEIVILERSGHVSFANCGLPYHVGGIIPERDSLIITSPQEFKGKFNVDVRTRHEVRSIDRQAKRVRVRELATGREYDEPYDKLILAVGASAVVPPVDGMRCDNVFTLRSMEDVDALCSYLAHGEVKRVAVIGAGFIGLEAAESLRGRGFEVDVVELLDQILPPLDADMAQVVAGHLGRNGVRLHLGSGLEGLQTRDGRAVAVLTRDGDRIETDAVLMSIGVRPESMLAREAGLAVNGRGAMQVDELLRTSDADIFAAGDVIEVTSSVTGTPLYVPLAGPAAKHGRLAGELAVSGEEPGPGTRAARMAGTAIVELFDQAVAVTGLNVRTARSQGLDCSFALVRRGHHVGYYPGAELMLVKLVYERGTQRVLGGQIVGGAGVDRRIDVLATVIHFQGTLQDLAELDLAYAPQFGAAKDPVHIAAQVGQNQEAGLVDHAEPEEVAGLREAGWQLVDVRSPESVGGGGSIPDNAHIPLGQLRSRLAELDPSRPVLLYCSVGYASYVAARLLSQRGFAEVRSLRGGFQWYAEQGLPVADTP